MRIGLIGAGRWAMQTHLPALLANPSVEVTGVWARRPGAAEAAASGTGVRGFDDLGALLQRCDAVAIAVTPRAQGELAIRAAAAGCDLILEKPLAADAAQAALVADAVEGAGAHAVVFATREWDPVRRDAMDALAGSAIGGTLHYAWRSRGFLGAGGTWRQHAGALVDVGPHMLPVMERIAGPIASIRSVRFPSASVVRAQFEHHGGAVSVLDVDMGVDVSFTEESIEAAGPVGVRRWANHEGIDFIDSYTEMLAAFERIRAGRPRDGDVARGAVRSQSRASDWITALETGRAGGAGRDAASAEGAHES